MLVAAPFSMARSASVPEDAMRTPASIAGHPIHPMLVPIAIGGSILRLVASGWLGGKMVYEAGVGVDVGTPNVR